MHLLRLGTADLLNESEDFEYNNRSLPGKSLHLFRFLQLVVL